jgi:HEAT repeat protein
MYRLPALPKPRTEYIFPTGAKELWLRALQRPEADMKCKAAHAIATAHREGFKGFETTIPALREVFDQQNQHPTVRLAVAEALIALDARQAAASFFRQAQSGSSDLRELVEPALARWDHRPAREVWLARLREPTTSSRNLMLSIRCLAEVREDKAVDPLRAIALSENVSGPIRLQAARALAGLRTSGLEKDAEQLSGDRSRRGLARRLVAVALLRQHRGADAVALLQRMARDPEPTVAAPAVARLLEIDPQLLDAWVDNLLDNRETNAVRDVNLRLLAVQVLYRRPSPEHLRQLVARLDDEHSGVRVAARDSLRQLAGDNKWRPEILKEAIGLLKSQRWRQLEQATILLVQLDHKSAADLLVKLLPFERAEVSITAAWGLRKLAVADTRPEVAKYIEAWLKSLPSGEDSSHETQRMPPAIRDHQLSQLIQFLGQQKYRPAEPLLRRFISKPSNATGGPESRAAAIWALGLIYEGGAPDDLVTAVEDRLNHATRRGLGDIPEISSVRWMAAIALGRWKAKQAVPSLRKQYEEQEIVRQACGWALEQITGEAMPPPQTIRKLRSEWFLIPSGEERKLTPSTTSSSR